MTISRRAFVAAGAASVFAGAARAAGPDAGLIRRALPGGEMIPIIGLGTARRYETAPDEAALSPLRDTLKRFKELGGTVIDTAPSYGGAEAIVGALLEGLSARQGLFLATKVGANDREAGKAQIEASFQKLKTPVIDMIGVHNLRDVNNQLATLRDLKAAGRIRYVGATTSFDPQYEPFEAMMRREKPEIVQVDYAIDNRDSANRILPLAKDLGMGVMINLPFGRERLFTLTRGKPLPDWASEIGATSWAQVFLKYVVSHPAVTVAVPGMAQVRYVEDNLQAAKAPLPDEAMRRRMETYIDAL